MKYLISLATMICASVLALITGLETIVYKFIFFTCIMIALYILAPSSWKQKININKLSTIQRKRLKILKFMVVATMIIAIISMFVSEYYCPLLLKKVAFVIYIVISTITILVFLISSKMR